MGRARRSVATLVAWLIPLDERHLRQILNVGTAMMVVFKAVNGARRKKWVPVMRPNRRLLIVFVLGGLVAGASMEAGRLLAVSQADPGRAAIRGCGSRG